MSTLTRKIVLYPLGDKEEINRVYKWLRDGIEAQNLAMNQYISALFAAEMGNMDSEDKKELSRLYTRLPKADGKGKPSAYDISMEFAKGLPTTSSLGQKVRQDFSNAMKKGLKYGRISLPSYRDTNPLLVHTDYVQKSGNGVHKKGFYHEYESHQDFVDAMLSDEEPSVYLDFPNNVKFKLVFGNIKKSLALRKEMIAIIEEEYKPQSSSIGFDKTGKKIVLNLSMDVPQIKHKLDENVVVGVDLGLNIPVVCALKDDPYTKGYIGSREEFINHRTKYQSRYRFIQRNLKTAKGGHGRSKKLKTLETLSQAERRYVHTKNHQYSRAVIDFALKHHAKYINMEDLSGIAQDEKNKFVLRNWSYYELQQMIEYKAKLHGIEVRKIDPYHTSKECAECGKIGERPSQPIFICKNPRCKCHDKEVNADFNGARNIAKSTYFITETSRKGKKKKDTMKAKVS